MGKDKVIQRAQDVCDFFDRICHLCQPPNNSDAHREIARNIFDSEWPTHKESLETYLERFRPFDREDMSQKGRKLVDYLQWLISEADKGFQAVFESTMIGDVRKKSKYNLMGIRMMEGILKYEYIDIEPPNSALEHSIEPATITTRQIHDLIKDRHHCALKTVQGWPRDKHFPECIGTGKERTYPRAEVKEWLRTQKGINLE